MESIYCQNNKTKVYKITNYIFFRAGGLEIIDLYSAL